MDQIEVTILICTLWKGLPHGLAAIQYETPNYWGDSFIGVGVFNLGKLHNTPFTCIAETGVGITFSNMQNGR